MKKSVFLLLAFVFSNKLFSQNILHGKLKDSLGRPVELANVLLFAQADTVKILKGATTDSTGSFSFSVAASTNYFIKIHAFGFNTYRQWVSSVKVGDTRLEDIILQPELPSLNNITVVAKRELIQKTKTGFVVSADATLSQQGGSATDLLRNTPTIFVDAEGAVTLRGKSPMILINGRNSKFDNLNSLSANIIDKIEIITTPGASYDAESENGIINIILKKGNTDGFNGAFSIANGAAYSWRSNNSVILNYKRKQWNWGVGYDNRLAERDRNAEGDRENLNSPNQYYLTQRRNDFRKEGIHSVRSNIDYTGKRETLGAELLLGFENETNWETLFNTIQNQGKLFQSKSKRFSDERRKSHSLEAAIKYNRSFRKEGQKLSVNLSNSNSNGKEQTAINTQSLSEQDASLGLPFNQRTYFNENGKIYNIRADYTQKLAEGILELGYKGLNRKIKTDFGQEDEMNGSYAVVANRTGILHFNEWVNGFYTQYRKSFITGFDFEVGARIEHTHNQGNVNSLQVNFQNNYVNFFPSANLGFKLGNNQSLRFTYGKRINRPSIGQLNPFVDITDSLTQRSGNPNLLPEISHNLELGYSKDLRNASFLAKVYFRHSINSILPFTVLRPDRVLFTQPLNAGFTNTLGFESVVSFAPLPSWKSNWSLSVFNQSIEVQNNSVQALNQLLSWNTKWINDFALGKLSKLQVIGVYNAPTPTLQGRRIAVYNVDLSFQHKLWKEKSRLGIIVTDIFNTQKNGFIWNTPDFNFSRIFKVDTRAVLLTFAYTFGTTFKEKLMENKFSND